MANMKDDIAKLEVAAQVIMAPPSRVTAADRREAEQIFMDFRRNLISFDLCRQILESTKSDFVMFEVSQILVQALLKQWHLLKEEDIISVCQYLIQFPASRPDLPNFVVAELLRSFAVIIKRASVDTEILNSDFLATSMEGLIRNGNETLQTFGLQAIEAVITEFSTAWRSPGVSLSWDFNARAKKQFEHILLKNFLKLSLTTLSQMLAHSDFSTPAHLKICDKFLRVSLIVFSWNFSQKLASIRLRALATIIKTSSFRPPISWSEFFEDASIVIFFAQLHSRVRHHEDLAISSLNCMAQLASVMGDVLGPLGSDESKDSNVSPTSSLRTDCRTHDHYLQTFVSTLIDLFADLHEYEMQPMSVIVYKLFTYHPVIVFKRFPPQLTANFAIFLFQKIIALTGPAMDAAIVKNEHIFHESLQNLYQAWRNMIRNSAIYSEEVAATISTHNIGVVEAFLKSVLSEPYGTRKEITEVEIREDGEDDEDDREVFMELLTDVGFFSQYMLDSCVQFVVTVLDHRIRQFRDLGSQNTTYTVQEIRRWQEDMHWMFLYIGFLFQQNSFDCISNLPDRMANRCLSGYRSGEFTRVDLTQMLERCFSNPFDSTFSTDKLDIVTKLTWYIFSWSVMEHNALASLDDIGNAGDLAALISPALTRSSLWVLSRLIAVLSPRDEGLDDGSGDGKMKSTGDAALLPRISISSPQLLAGVIDFILKKVFTVLSKMSGEEKLCDDAVQLIVFFADYCADVLAHSDQLYNLLSSVDLSTLLSRRSLIKSLVMIGSMVVSEELRNRMYKTILAPLETNFNALLTADKADQSVVGRLVDFYDCFTGVAEAGQSDSVQLLFRFLKPVFRASVNLLQKYSESQLLLNAILDFYQIVTDVLFYYVETPEDCSIFHEELLSLVNTYRNTQMSKYRTASSTTMGTTAQQLLISGTLDELEYQTKDLCTLMEILSHSLSKTHMPTYDGAGSVENSAKVAILGLELILPLMGDELLKIPTLCGAFFRLIVVLSDLAPRVLSQMNDTMNNALIHCLNLALDDTYGQERLKSALEIINNLVTFFCSGLDVPTSSSNEPLPFIAHPISAFLPKVFAAALEHSSDSDVFAEASNAMCALICMNKNGFSIYVNELLERPENVSNADKIKMAFLRLLPSSEDVGPSDATRMEKRNFRDRFEKFLIEIYGLLYL